MNEKLILKENKKAWNPIFISIISIVLSFFTAGILTSINQKRMGKTNESSGTLFFTIILFVIFYILVIIFEDSKLVRIIFGSAGFFGAYSFYKEQKKSFEEYKTSGNQPESIFKGLLISILIFCVFSAIIFVSFYLKYTIQDYIYNNKYSEAKTFIEQKNYTEASILLKEIKKYDSEFYAVSFDLAYIYYEKEQYEECRNELINILTHEPDNKAAKELFDEIDKTLIK